VSLIAGLRLLVASIRFAIIFQGPFTSLRFSKKANRLVSGSDDGMIAIWRTKDWVCVSFKPAHKGSVTDLDVNPSGKVMISCGRETLLKTVRVSGHLSRHHFVQCRGRNDMSEEESRPLRCCASVRYKI